MKRRRKKRFDCNHVGYGKYCHRCEQEGVAEKQGVANWNNSMKNGKKK